MSRDHQGLSLKQGTSPTGLKTQLAKTYARPQAHPQAHSSSHPLFIDWTLPSCLSMLQSPSPPACQNPGPPTALASSSWLAEASEIVLVAVCSWVTASYTVEAEAFHESGTGTSSPNQPGTDSTSSTISLTIHSSPLFMLGSCLVFGCAVSSFVYRRQKQDSLQIAVFVLVILLVDVVGYGVGASANMILLVYLPLATCASMILSVVGHAAWRQYRLAVVGKGSQDEEKTHLLQGI